MAFERARQKLYFDVAFPAATRSRIYFPCTAFRSSASFGDRYGGLLNAVEALTGSSPNSLKAKFEVKATFIPAHNQFVASTQVTSLQSAVWLSFVKPTFGTLLTGCTGGGDGGTAAPATRLPYKTPFATDLRKQGMSAVFGTLGGLRHFSVAVQRVNTAATSLYGTLYVERQHSIEV